MVRRTVLTLTIGLTLAGLCLAVQQPNFAGEWLMDRDRSFGMPGNMQQTMAVTQNADQIDVETRLIQPGNEQTVKDSYVLDGKERDFTPQTAPNAPPAKGKRTANWLPNGKGVVINEITTSETDKGTVTRRLTRKWSLSNLDTANGQFETKRIFKRK